MLKQGQEDLRAGQATRCAALADTFLTVQRQRRSMVDEFRQQTGKNDGRLKHLYKSYRTVCTVADALASLPLEDRVVRLNAFRRVINAMCVIVRRSVRNLMRKKSSTGKVK